MTPPRTCGPCQACCNVLHVEELQSPSPRWHDCPHQCEAGCGIYQRRPEPCQAFRCAWLEGWGEERDRPDRLGLMLELLPARPGDAPARAIATEIHPAGAQGERPLDLLRGLQSERQVVVVSHGAKGFESLGEDLPPPS